MEFRIGINLGDVVQENGNLYGEDVNIAARLEALAQPNGICVSKNVYDLVKNKTHLFFSNLGEQRVKDTVVYAFDLSTENQFARFLSAKLVLLNKETICLLKLHSVLIRLALEMALASF